MAASIDDRADSGWRGAQDGQTLLSRTKAGLGEVLRRAPAAEPRVVGWVEDEGRAVALVDHMAGEDDLVAELEADLAPLEAEVDGARSRPGREVEVTRSEAGDAKRGQQRPHGQIFAVRDEVGFVIAAHDPAARAKRIDTVSRTRHMNAVARLNGDAAREERIARPKQG